MLYLFQTLATKPTSPAPLILSPSHSRRNGHHHYYRRHRYRYRQMLILSLTMLTPPTHLLHYLLTFTNFIFESKLSSSPSSSSSSPLASSSSLSSPPPAALLVTGTLIAPREEEYARGRSPPVGPYRGNIRTTNGSYVRQIRSLYRSHISHHCTDHTYLVTVQIIQTTLTHLHHLQRFSRGRSTGSETSAHVLSVVIHGVWQYHARALVCTGFHVTICAICMTYTKIPSH